MKVLLVNKFLFPKGGDALSAINTGRLLESHGHKVIWWGMKHPLNPAYEHLSDFMSYVDYEKSGSAIYQAKMAARLLYSLEAKRKIIRIMERERPDIVHLHNIAHQISPSILHSLKKYRIPIVMTMHDYKLVCPSYLLISNNETCEKCKNGRYYFCALNNCIKESTVKSLLGSFEMYLHHKILHIYDLIDIFISPSMFLKNKIREMGFKKKIVYLPNFINVNEYSPQYDWTTNSIVYFGRLSQEKGISILVDAIQGLEIELKIIGDGPLMNNLRTRAEQLRLKNVAFMGYCNREILKYEIKKSKFVVLPSKCYENHPLSIIEGFALGKPAVGARIGGIPELIKENYTGLTFEAGNVQDLHNKIRFLSNNRTKIVEMGENARKCVENEHSAEKHYDSLIKIYDQAGALSESRRR